MIPFFLFPLLGFLTMEQIQAIFMQDITKSYTKRDISQWVIDHIVNSEGFKENAYKLNNENQFTIGCGTSYLFLGSGAPFNRNGSNAVRNGDTLSLLKNLMGYSSLTSKQFAVQLVKNYIMGNGISSFLTMQEIEKRNVPYFDVVKDAVLEFSYGSGSMHRILPKKIEFGYFLDSLKTRDLSNIASKYALMRYSYYKINTLPGQWSKYKTGWMLRIFVTSMYIKGVEIKNPASFVGYTGNSSTYKNIELAFLKHLGVNVSMQG